MRHVILLLLMVLASGARGQMGPVAYADRAGGPESDTASGVVADFEGNIIMVGTLDGTATFGAITVDVDETGCVFSTCHDGYVAKYAPDGTALWVRRMGTSVHNDFAESVALSGDVFEVESDIVVSGYFTGEATWDGGNNPDISLTTRSDFDAFLARYTASGDLLWVIQAGGTDQDTGRGVSMDRNGVAFWTGSFHGTATLGAGNEAVTLTSEGSSDGFIARIDPDGSLAWVVQVGGQDAADAYDAAIAPYEADLVVTGSFDGLARIGSSPLQSRGETDGYIARLDPGDGTVLWTQQVGGSGDDHLRGISLDEYQASAAVAGWFSGQILVGDDVLTSAGMTDVLVASVDLQSGGLRWGRRGGGAGIDLAKDIHAVFPPPIATFGGGPQTTPPLLVVGYIDGAVTFEDASGTSISLDGQGRDGFLAAYKAVPFRESYGNLIMAIPLGGPSQDAASGVTATPSFSTTFPPSGEPNLLSAYAIVAGTFRETATPFGETIQSAGSNDAFLAKLATCPGLFCLPTAEEPTPEASGVRLTIAPHPASGDGSTLTVALDAPGPLHVELFDARGRRIATLADGLRAAGEHLMPLPRLAPGTYLVRAATPEAFVSEVVTVAR